MCFKRFTTSSCFIDAEIWVTQPITIAYLHLHCTSQVGYHHIIPQVCAIPLQHDLGLDDGQDWMNPARRLPTLQVCERLCAYTRVCVCLCFSTSARYAPYHCGGSSPSNIFYHTHVWCFKLVILVIMTESPIYFFMWEKTDLLFRAWIDHRNPCGLVLQERKADQLGRIFDHLPGMF